jgi:DNA-binding IclR family transcriptional regulator
MRNEFVGALGAVGAKSRMDQARAEEIKDILLERAATLSSTLGGKIQPREAGIQVS